MNSYAKLVQSKQTVFTVQLVKMILGISDDGYARLLLHRMKKQGLLVQPMRGFFTFEEYDVFELATKLQQKSYISFETALQYHGISFQNYDKTITLAGPNTLHKIAGNIHLEYHKLSDYILSHPLGIQFGKGGTAMAGPERAVTDMIYLNKNVYFDNVHGLDIQMLESLKSLYPNTIALLISKLQQDVGSKSS